MPHSVLLLTPSDHREPLRRPNSTCPRSSRADSSTLHKSLQMSGSPDAKQLGDVETRKHPDNLPAVITIYQGPKASGLKL